VLHTNGILCVTDLNPRKDMNAKEADALLQDMWAGPSFIGPQTRVERAGAQGEPSELSDAEIVELANEIAYARNSSGAHIFRSASLIAFARALLSRRTCAQMQRPLA
jgi:hypothetical protein